jgi:hypothetical protein
MLINISLLHVESSTQPNNRCTNIGCTEIFLGRQNPFLIIIKLTLLGLMLFNTKEEFTTIKTIGVRA